MSKHRTMLQQNTAYLSEVVLIDLNEEHLAVVQTLARKMARAQGLDLTIRTTTNRREGLQDCERVASRAGEGLGSRYGCIQ